MAEQSVVIADQESGHSIATRSARLPDDTTLSDRTIQLVDQATRTAIFQRAYSALGEEGIIALTRGDDSRFVIGIKSFPIFTKITVIIAYEGLYNASDELFAVRKIELLPADMFLPESESTYVASAPISFDLDGASKIRVRFSGEGFQADAGFYCYAGLV